MNIIPDSPGQTPNYWCSWSTQNYENKPAPAGEEATPLVFIGDQGAKAARDAITEETIFGPNGWIHQFPAVRKDLFFLLDDGWDVPFGVHPDTRRDQFGSLEVAVDRFPSCTGHPAQRLKKLNEMVKSHGWRGLGIWVAAQNTGEALEATGPQSEAYWRQRVLWSRDAQVHYWKVDWGTHCDSVEFRRMLTELAKEHCPELWIEHANCSVALNGGADNPANRGARFRDREEDAVKGANMLAVSRILRSYDVSAQLSVPTTLDRVAGLLQGDGGLVNCEDELYLGAALGCAVGVMRSSRWNEYSEVPYDPWQQKKRLDEVTRAIRWQRLAPAFAGTALLESQEVLRDEWRFASGDSWFTSVNGHLIAQEAPAVVARNMPLPEVEYSANEPERPYIVASKNPNGAVTVAALGRIKNERTPCSPSAAVTLGLDRLPEHLGVFGSFDALRLEVAERESLSGIFAQDLAGDCAVDITDQVIRDGNTICIPGALLAQIGLSAAVVGDLSQPGLAIYFARS